MSSTARILEDNVSWFLYGGKKPLEGKKRVRFLVVSFPEPRTFKEKSVKMDVGGSVLEGVCAVHYCGTKTDTSSSGHYWVSTRRGDDWFSVDGEEVVEEEEGAGGKRSGGKKKHPVRAILLSERVPSERVRGREQRGFNCCLNSVLQILDCGKGTIFAEEEWSRLQRKARREFSSRGKGMEEDPVLLLQRIEVPTIEIPLLPPYDLFLYSWPPTEEVSSLLSSFHTDSHSLLKKKGIPVHPLHYLYLYLFCGEASSSFEKSWKAYFSGTEDTCFGVHSLLRSRCEKYDSFFRKKEFGMGLLKDMQESEKDKKGRETFHPSFFLSLSRLPRFLLLRKHLDGDKKAAFLFLNLATNRKQGKNAWEEGVNLEKAASYCLHRIRESG